MKDERESTPSIHYVKPEMTDLGAAVIIQGGVCGLGSNAGEDCLVGSTATYQCTTGGSAELNG